MKYRPPKRIPLTHGYLAVADKSRNYIGFNIYTPTGDYVGFAYKTHTGFAAAINGTLLTAYTLDAIAEQLDNLRATA